MSFGPEFSSQEQPPAPVSSSNNYVVGTVVVLMFLMGVVLLWTRLRARGRKFARVSRRPIARTSRGATAVTPIAPANPPEEIAQRHSA
jgi:hypothetical protein